MVQFKICLNEEAPPQPARRGISYLFCPSTCWHLDIRLNLEFNGILLLASFSFVPLRVSSLGKDYLFNFSFVLVFFLPCTILIWKPSPEFCTAGCNNDQDPRASQITKSQDGHINLRSIKHTILFKMLRFVRNWKIIMIIWFYHILFLMLISLSFFLIIIIFSV